MAPVVGCMTSPSLHPATSWPGSAMIPASQWWTKPVRQMTSMSAMKRDVAVHYSFKLISAWRGSRRSPCISFSQPVNCIEISRCQHQLQERYFWASYFEQSKKRLVSAWMIFMVVCTKHAMKHAIVNYDNISCYNGIYCDVE